MEISVLALDFDGVIVDSMREVYLLSLRAFAELEPSSRLPGRDPGWSLPAPDDDPLLRAFAEMVPLGNRAEDFGVMLSALERGERVADQAAYDAIYGQFDPAWLAEFHEEFYRQRKRLLDDDRAGWLALQPPYPTFRQLLLRHAGEVPYAVLTARDATSVRLLLEHCGLAELFPPSSVLDKETGRHKTAHLELLAGRLGVPFTRITFVDDKLNHLVSVAPLGVRPVLADWGHNSPREHEAARRLGFAVATLETAEAMLFGSRPGA